MINAAPKLSIVCPAYEEEEVLPLFHRELAAALDRLGDRFQVEILYVDDGSRDRTLEVIRELARGDARVRYLSFSRNFGHQAALTAGLEHAGGDAVLMLDSDLQHPPALIPDLVERWQAGADVVITVRGDDPALGLFKRLSSKMFYRVMRWLSETEVRFAAADYRLMSRRALDALLQLRESHRFLRGMVQWLGFPTAEVPFQPALRQAGVSKYTVRRMTSFAADALLSFSRLPLRLALGLGLPAVLFGLGYGGYTAVRALLWPASFEATWAFLLVSVYLVGGCILCGLGLVGEYVGRIYEQVKGRPLYVLKESSHGALGAPSHAGIGRAA
jgi:dolichol-phosphate mannosyltransferase